jgi:hypothetical protein
MGRVLVYGADGVRESRHPLQGFTNAVPGGDIREETRWPRVDTPPPLELPFPQYQDA